MHGGIVAGVGRGEQRRYSGACRAGAPPQGSVSSRSGSFSAQMRSTGHVSRAVSSLTIFGCPPHPRTVHAVACFLPRRPHPCGSDSDRHPDRGPGDPGGDLTSSSASCRGAGPHPTRHRAGACAGGAEEGDGPLGGIHRRAPPVATGRVAGLRNWSGTLRLEQDGRRYVLSTSMGRSPMPRATPKMAGRVLVDGGVLTATQLADSLEQLGRSPEARHLDVLVKMGLLQGDAVDRAARLGLARRALRAFKRGRRRRSRSRRARSPSARGARSSRAGSSIVRSAATTTRGVWSATRPVPRQRGAPRRGPGPRAGAVRIFTDEELIVLGVPGEGILGAPRPGGGVHEPRRAPSSSRRWPR